MGYWEPEKRTSDPNTSGWGTNEAGRMWVNTTDDQLKMWDGSTIVTIGPGAGGVSKHKHDADTDAAGGYELDPFKMFDGTYINASDYATLNAAYTALPTINGYKHGIIYMPGRSAAYDITGSAIVHDGAEDHYHYVGIIGEGWRSTRIDVASGINAFEIKDYARIFLGGFQISMPTSSGGHAIYGMDDGTSKISMFQSEIKDIRFTGGDSTHEWIYIKNPHEIKVSHLCGYSAGTVKGAMKIESTESGKNRGNSVYDHLRFRLATSETNGTGLAIVSTAGIMNLDEFGFLQFNRATTGINLQGVSHDLFKHVDIEICTDAIKLEGSGSYKSDKNTFLHGYIYSFTQYGTWCTADARGNDFKHLYLEGGGGSAVAIRDQAAALNYPNAWKRCALDGTMSGTPIDEGTYTVLEDLDGPTLPAKYRYYNRLRVQAGSAGNRGVIKTWDATAGAWRYCFCDNGSWTCQAGEPT